MPSPKLPVAIANAVYWEAVAGNADLAKQQALTELSLSNGREVEGLSALGLALAGDSGQATRLADDLAKRFPADTLVQSGYLPMIHAAVALESGNAAKAVDALAPAASYELGRQFPGYPAYLRGQAHLKLRQGNAAAAEFQKIVDHLGELLTDPTGAFAHLGLARAHALSGDKANARVAYQDFLALCAATGRKNSTQIVVVEYVCCRQPISQANLENASARFPSDSV